MTPTSPPDQRLARQLDFLRDADRLKGVERRTRLIDRSRHENSAEHSWHLALMALTARVPGVDRETAEALVREADRICPYSNALRGTVPVTIRVE